MFIRVGRLLGFALLAAVITSVAASARVPLPVHTRTYRFTARIEDNAGVSPFKVGERFKGTFTYDLKSRNTVPGKAEHGNYESRRNSLTFRLGDLRFSGAGKVKVTIGAFGHAEHFQVFASDLDLPEGNHPRRHSRPAGTARLREHP
jgi:hypothetical protein